MRTLSLQLFLWRSTLDGRHRSWSYVLLITSGPYIIGEVVFYWHTLSLWPKASDATHPGKFWLCLERKRPYRCSKSSAVLPCVFSLLVFNALISATSVWSQTKEDGYWHIVVLLSLILCLFFLFVIWTFCSVRPSTAILSNFETHWANLICIIVVF